GSEIAGTDHDVVGRRTVPPEIGERIHGFAHLRGARIGGHGLHDARQLVSGDRWQAFDTLAGGVGGPPGELGRGDATGVDAHQCIARPGRRFGCVFIDQLLRTTAPVQADGFHRSTLSAPRGPPTYGAAIECASHLVIVLSAGGIHRRRLPESPGARRMAKFERRTALLTPVRRRTDRPDPRSPWSLSPFREKPARSATPRRSTPSARISISCRARPSKSCFAWSRRERQRAGWSPSRIRWPAPCTRTTISLAPTTCTSSAKHRYACATASSPARGRPWR